MQTIFCEDFESYCREHYDNYLRACLIFGIEQDDSFERFKENNIERLEASYENSGRYSLH